MIVCVADVQRGQLSPSLGVEAARATEAGGQWTVRASGVEGDIYGSMHPISPLQNLPSSWNTSNKVPRALRTRYLFWGIRGTYPAIVPCTRRTPTSNMSFDAPAAGADNRSAPPNKKGAWRAPCSFLVSLLLPSPQKLKGCL